MLKLEEQYEGDKTFDALKSFRWMEGTSKIEDVEFTILLQLLEELLPLF